MVNQPIAILYIGLIIKSDISVSSYPTISSPQSKDKCQWRGKQTMACTIRKCVFKGEFIFCFFTFGAIASNCQKLRNSDNSYAVHSVSTENQPKNHNDRYKQTKSHISADPFVFISRGHFRNP
jgi:hypothetical protein